ncbi:MAG: nicotinate phosphoribosyltransferase, partial [Nitrospinota bacterium]|nr:nicotinate phosphoribosyltransferase [Nitrospinota bacterium]
PSDLNLPEIIQIISKDTEQDQETYSGFQGTDLDKQMQSLKVRRLFIGGLATDYCVLNTVKDALKLGYEVSLLEDAIRPINVHPQDGTNAIREMVEGGSRLCKLNDIESAETLSDALLTDFYQLAMMQGYFDQGMNKTAVFEFYVRNLPANRNFLMAAGLEQVLQYLKNLSFTSQDLQWLERSGKFKKTFVQSLENFRFKGNVEAMPEGTVFFPNEPIIKITAPLGQAQFVETRIINFLQYQTLIATKAARMVLAAPDKSLIDFGLRRAHSPQAGLLAARASYLAGFTGTATVQAGAIFGIPVFGTMAHSFIQAHEDESHAFENFARSHPENVILLLDTYNTEKAARKVAALAPKLKKEGILIKGVRLDSGDFSLLAPVIRKILDEGGLQQTTLFASGNLDEFVLQKFTTNKTPLDGFGIGTRLTTTEDAPSLECVYKLQEYDRRPKFKRSKDKETLPGSKQVYRQTDKTGNFSKDILALSSDELEGEPLLIPCMRNGRRITSPVSLSGIREYASRQLDRLPKPFRSLDSGPDYPVELSPSVKNLTASLEKQYTWKD